MNVSIVIQQKKSHVLLKDSQERNVLKHEDLYAHRVRITIV